MDLFGCKVHVCYQWFIIFHFFGILRAFQWKYYPVLEGIYFKPTKRWVVINLDGFVLIEAKWFKNSLQNKVFMLEEKLMEINCIKLLQKWVGQNISDIVVKNREFALRGSIEVIVIHLISSQVDSFYISWRRIITNLFQLPLVNKIKPTTVTLSKASILILEFIFIHFGNVGPCGVDFPILMLSTYLLFTKGRINWRIVWIRSQSG